ncbi:MAG: alpha/beta hydrolase family protein [Candidatus Limnocylindria bacterium]
MPASSLRIHLAHGASGSAASMRPWTAGLAQRGFEAAPVQLPRSSAERATSAFRDAAPPGPRTVIGGHSFGGRVASLLAAEDGYAGLVLLSYPLHRPGHPETVEARTAHWARISCPVLLLSGESDPFARIAELRDAVPRLRSAKVVTYPGVRHGLNAVREDALDRIAAWLEKLVVG